MWRRLDNEHRKRGENADDRSGNHRHVESREGPKTGLFFRPRQSARVHPKAATAPQAGDRCMSQPIAASATATTVRLTNTRQPPRLDATSTLVLPCATMVSGSENTRRRSVRIRDALLTT